MATLNDSGLDARRSVTAFFDSEAAADKARSDLLASGFSAETVNLVAGSETSTAVASETEGGFWHALKEFFMPDEDRYTYAEGLRRGGYALSVTTTDAEYDRALDILDADGAIDIDERERQWRDEGWAGYSAIDPLGMGGGLTGVGLAGADASTAGFGASLAGEDGYARPATTTLTGTPDAETRADVDRVGTGSNDPGRLNPDMRERIGAGTASMTPPTPTGAQDDSMTGNAADFDRGRLSPAAAAEDAALGSPTRSGSETPAATSTIGSVRSDAAGGSPALDSGITGVRRDDSIQRARVRGYIVDPRQASTDGNGRF